MKKNTFTSFQWCSALESVNHISWLQYIILLHEVLIQSFRIKFLFVIMGLGLFLKIIFRLTRATISYRVSTWRSSPSTSSSVSIVFSSFLRFYYQIFSSLQQMACQAQQFFQLASDDQWSSVVRPEINHF